MGVSKTRSEIEFIFHDELTNETMVLYGEVNGALIPSGINVSALGGKARNGNPVDDYDGPGALAFVVTVIVVYGISMFLLVATLLRRKSYHKSLDVEVDRYIKGMEAARLEAKRESVLRTRLRWPGNFIHFNSGRHNYDSKGGSDSNEDPSASDNDTADSDSSESSSYTEMPATTMVLPSPSIHSTGDSDVFTEVKVDTVPDVEVEYPPGFNRHNRRRVSMFPETEITTSKKDRIKSSRMSERRRGRQALVLDIEYNDSDSSYVELPATTVTPTEDGDFYRGSLACEGGKKVVMREDEERGGVEIIPQDGEEEMDTEEDICAGKSENTNKGEERQKTVHFVQDCEMQDSVKHRRDEVFWQDETEHSFNSSEMPVESSPIRRMPSSPSCPQSIQTVTPNFHCQRQPLCLSSEDLLTLPQVHKNISYPQGPDQYTRRPAKQHGHGRTSRRSMSPPPVYEPVWNPNRVPIERRGPIRSSPVRCNVGYQEKQRRTGLVETDIDAILGVSTSTLAASIDCPPSQATRSKVRTMSRGNVGQSSPVLQVDGATD